MLFCTGIINGMKGGTILDKKYAIMLVGLPGTGKTTISNRISSMLSFFAVLQIQSIRNYLMMP